jgi:hypothetical protein
MTLRIAAIQESPADPPPLGHPEISSTEFIGERMGLRKREVEEPVFTSRVEAEEWQRRKSKECA